MHAKRGIPHLLHGYLLLLTPFLKWAAAQTIPNNSRLLNAYNAPLSALTAPHTYYFLEFPIPGTPGSKSDAWEFPMCADESPFSFIFRRGTEDHLKKLVVELEGGPACWNDDENDLGDEEFCECISSGKRRTDWHDYTMKQGTDIGSTDFAFPSLGICTGVPPGFIRQGESIIFDKNDENDGDLPLFLRWENGKKGWWDSLSGENSDIEDWSYIFIPHCTLDWHLGRVTTEKNTGCSDVPSLHHRGGFNTESVMEWVTTEFSSIGGLDALVTVSGGKVGGCFNSGENIISATSASSIASLTFAKEVTSKDIVPPSSALAIMDGASLWNPNIPSQLDMMQQWKADIHGSENLMQHVASSIVMSSYYLNVAWISSSDYDADTASKEMEWVKQIAQFSADSFTVHIPPSDNDGSVSTCPLYAFPTESTNDDFGDFIKDLTMRMPWPTSVQSNASSGSTTNTSKTISFFTIALILLGLYVISWGIFLILKHHRQRRNLPPSPSPSDLWFRALTRYPVLFLFISLFIPILLSWLAFAYDDYKLHVNLDFDTYLDIDTKEERAANQYEEYKSYHYSQVSLEDKNCNMLYRGMSGNSFSMRGLETSRALEDIVFEEPVRDRHLQGVNLYGKPKPNQVTITFFYQNRNGGNVFEPAVLDEIRDFEQTIRDFPGFEESCYGMSECFPFDSLIPYLYPDGENLVGDVERVLKGFLGSETALSKMDKFFSRDNLASNVTMTQVWFKEDKTVKELKPLLEMMYDMLWNTDQERKYPNLVFTWGNPFMETLESNNALSHDALWSLASIAFIGLMVFVKVGNLFVATASVLCLVLAFTSALYWCEHHFVFNQLTMMHVAGLFVMLGIGADDIFLTIDTFDHTKVDYYIESNSNQELSSTPQCLPLQLNPHREPNAIRERMIRAYKTAGSMMLVSSLTTAICFFSNSFGVLTAIRDFGTFMGMVVLLNYVHVMTILPSAMLVNELHIAPTRRKLWKRIRPKQKANTQQDHLVENIGVTQIGLTLDRDEFDENENDDNRNNNTASISITKENQEGSEEDEDEENRKSIASIDEIADTAIAIGADSEPNDFSHKCDRVIDDYDENGHIGFLEHTSQMTMLDRFFVGKYAPCIHRWRFAFFLVSVAMAITFGALAIKNFSLYDGTIIVFKENYNLGRLQRIGDSYFNEELVKIFQEESEAFSEIQDGNTGSGTTTSSSNNGVSGSGANENEIIITDNRPSTPLTSGPTQSPTKSTSGSPSIVIDPDEVASVVTPISSPSSSPNISSFGPTSEPTDNDKNSSGSSDPSSTVLTTDPSFHATTTIDSSTYTATTTIPTKWHAKLEPDWFNGICTNDPNEVSYYGEFSTQSECCSTMFPNQPSNACLIDAGLYESSTTSTSLSSTTFVTTTIQYCSGNHECVDGEMCSSDGICIQNVTAQPASGGDSAGTPATPPVLPTTNNNESAQQPVAAPSLSSQPEDNINQSTAIQAPGITPISFPSISSTNQDMDPQPSSSGEIVASPPSISSLPESAAVPTMLPTPRPTPGPTLVPSVALSCPDGWDGVLCLDQAAEVLKQRELFVVSLVWGMEPQKSKPRIWMVDKTSRTEDTNIAIESPKGSNLINPANPKVQEWLFKIITLARNDAGLQVNGEVTWIEAVEKFAVETGVGFPLPEQLFLGTVQLLKSQSNFFRLLVKREISTDSPGITGDFLYTSISVLSEVPITETSWSSEALTKWSNFTDYVNSILPDEFPPLSLQSSAFLDSQRTQATVESTVTTYFVANGLCLLIILLFTQNILLTLMIMATLLLIFFCLGGLLFNVFMIDFGPVEALGVSIFVGLSANYSLHIAHAYHSSDINERKVKIQRTVFVTGSPILASALSTIGGSSFLFACRSWLLTELGILICAIIALSLFFSMIFLLAWLAMFGPLPQKRHINKAEAPSRIIHAWDLGNIFFSRNICSRKRNSEEPPEIDAGTQ